jgi:hypothetical protein
MNINILPCKKRLEGTKAGQLMFFICNQRDCPDYKKRVTEDICNSCSHREGANQSEQRSMAEDTTHGRPRFFPDGTIAYPKRGYEPPPIPPGYRRKCADLKNSDAWIFLPVLPACRDRKHEIEYGHCGACKISYYCANNHEGIKVRIHDLSTCNKCIGL